MEQLKKPEFLLEQLKLIKLYNLDFDTFRTKLPKIISLNDCLYIR